MINLVIIFLPLAARGLITLLTLLYLLYFTYFTFHSIHSIHSILYFYLDGERDRETYGDTKNNN